MDYAHTLRAATAQGTPRGGWARLTAWPIAWSVVGALGSLSLVLQDEAFALTFIPLCMVAAGMAVLWLARSGQHAWTGEWPALACALAGPLLAYALATGLWTDDLPYRMRFALQRSTIMEQVEGLEAPEGARHRSFDWGWVGTPLQAWRVTLVYDDSGDLPTEGPHTKAAIDGERVTLHPLGDHFYLIAERERPVIDIGPIGKEASFP